jgi:hypothetical protein
VEYINSESCWNDLKKTGKELIYISSQRYLDDEIVEKKKEKLIQDEEESIEVPCSYVGLIYGQPYAIIMDKHHTMAAAKELGLAIDYVVDDDDSNLIGDELLQARWMDSDYYDIRTGITVDF